MAKTSDTNIRPAGAQPLVLSAPPKPVNEMTDEELSAWADEVVNGMGNQVARLTEPDNSPS